MSWTVPPTQFSKELREDHREHTAEIAMAIHRNLVLTTPVDTGRARSNWLPSVGTPRVNEVSATDAMTAIMAAEAEFMPEGLPFWPTLYIANNLPYIRKLNEGHSRQAPAHFVELAISWVVDG